MKKPKINPIMWLFEKEEPFEKVWCGCLGRIDKKNYSVEYKNVVVEACHSYVIKTKGNKRWIKEVCEKSGFWRKRPLPDLKEVPYEEQIK